MKFRVIVIIVCVLFGYGANCWADSSEILLVNFTNDYDEDSRMLSSKLDNIDSIDGINITKVNIDTSSADEWEKSARTAFKYDIVSVFNKWVGLPGFAVIIDGDSKQIIGCLNNTLSVDEIAHHINQEYTSTNMVSHRIEKTRQEIDASIGVTKPVKRSLECPPSHNTDPGR